MSLRQISIAKYRQKLYTMRIMRPSKVRHTTNPQRRANGWLKEQVGESSRRADMGTGMFTVKRAVNMREVDPKLLRALDEIKKTCGESVRILPKLSVSLIAPREGFRIQETLGGLANLNRLKPLEEAVKEELYNEVKARVGIIACFGAAVGQAGDRYPGIHVRTQPSDLVAQERKALFESVGINLRRESFSPHVSLAQTRNQEQAMLAIDVLQNSDLTGIVVPLFPAEFIRL